MNFIQTIKKLLTGKKQTSSTHLTADQIFALEHQRLNANALYAAEREALRQELIAKYPTPKKITRIPGTATWVKNTNEHSA